VVFKTREKDLTALASRLEEAFEAAFEFRSRVIVRTLTEFKAAARKNPFHKREAIDPGRLLLMFLAADPGPDAHAAVRALANGPEELWSEGRELYIYFPIGMARQKLWPGPIEKAIGVAGTARNWRTVRAIIEMAELTNTAGND
jgi:uncharacterized protein (DUF1697 family)